MAKTQLEILLSARDQASATVYALRQEFKNLDGEVAKLQRRNFTPQIDATGARDFNDQLRSIAQFLRGRGDFMAINMVGRELAHATEQAKEFASALAQGQTTLGEFAEKSIGSVPIVGQFYTAGQNIRAMLQDLRSHNAQQDKPGGELQFHFGPKGISLEVSKAQKAMSRDEAESLASPETQQKIEEGREKIREQLDRQFEESQKAERERGKKGLALKLQQIDEEYRAEMAKIQKAGKGIADLRESEQPLRRKEIALAKAGAESDKAAKDAEATRKSEEDQLRIVRDARDKLADAKAQAQAKELRANGAFFAAQMVEINQHYADRMRAAKEAQEREISAHPENHTAASFARQMEQDAAETERQSGTNLAAGESLKRLYADHEKSLEHAKRLKEEQLSTDRELAEITIRRVESEAEIGSTSAHFAAEKLKVTKEYADQIERAKKILQDINATFGQKIFAGSELAKLLRQEKQAVARAGAAGIGDQAEVIGGERFGGTGVGLARRDKLEEISTKLDDQKKAISDASDAICAAVKSIIPGSITSIFGGK